MALKKRSIPKDLLDEAIVLTREYYSSGSPEALSSLTDRSRRIEEKTGIWWNNIENLLSSILSYHGIKPDATPEDIYAILRLLGWEVPD